jgi:acetyltransferase-like isoleucine patch superfamily enzyme
MAALKPENAAHAAEDWQTTTGLSREEFEKFTRFCNMSEDCIDNRNRARILGFKEDNVRISIGAVVRIRPPGGIGRNSYVGLYCYVNGIVKIGENVLIGPHCSLAGGNHKFDVKTQSFTVARSKDDLGIVIGDGSWLATGVTVTAGANIGKCNLICANTVVTKPTRDYAIVAGTPARQVGSIDPQTGEYRWFKE